MASEQFSLCWDNFHKNMSSGMNSLLENEDLVDVTLAVEGKYLKAHKMVLSVCSPYFRELFKTNPCKHPIVFMKDVSYIAMSDLLQFMYQGEVQVSQENLTTFIKTAEALQIKGLTGDGNGSAECDNEPQEESKVSEPEMPKVNTMRPKKVHQTPPTPAAKRPRLSAPPEPTVTAPPITKTEPSPITSAPSNEQLIQFKMEPYDQGQSSVTIPDDNPDDAFTDDPLDETNADDTNEDYSMMEGGDEEPQAGTSADGTAGEGQAKNILKQVKNEPYLISPPIRVKELHSLQNPEFHSNKAQSPSQNITEEEEPQVIWKGLLAWHGVCRNLSKVIKSVPCEITATLEVGESELNTDDWPQTLLIRMIPKYIFGNMKEYWKSSKFIQFHPEECEVLDSLKNVLGSKYVGCLHLTNNQNIILFYNHKRCIFVGCIPKDQLSFISNAFKETLKHVKFNTRAINI